MAKPRQKLVLHLCTFFVLLVLCDCALPVDISNYVNEYVCSTDVRLVR